MASTTEYPGTYMKARREISALTAAKLSSRNASSKGQHKMIDHCRCACEGAHRLAIVQEKCASLLGLIPPELCVPDVVACTRSCIVAKFSAAADRHSPCRLEFEARELLVKYGEGSKTASSRNHQLRCSDKVRPPAQHPLL